MTVALMTVGVSLSSDRLTHSAVARLAEEKVAAWTEPLENFRKKTVQLSLAQVLKEPTAENDVEASFWQVQTGKRESQSLSPPGLLNLQQYILPHQPSF